MQDPESLPAVPFLDRLTTKIMVAAIVFLFALAAAVGFQVEAGFRRSQYGAYLGSRDALQTHLEDDFLAAAAGDARLLDERLRSFSAALPGLAQALEGDLAHPAWFAAPPADAAAQAAISADPIFIPLDPIDAAASPPPAGADAALARTVEGAIRRRLAAGDLPPGRVTWIRAAQEADTAALIAATPVLRSGRPVGAAAAALPVERLSEWLAAGGAPGERRFLFIDGEAVGITPPGEAAEIARIGAAIAESGGQEPQLLPVVFAGADWLLALAPLSDPSWRLARLTPQAAIRAAAEAGANAAWGGAEQTIRSTLAMVILFFLIGVPAVMMAMDRLFNRRINRLIRSTRAIAAGDLEPPPLDAGPDELGRLGRAFNHMAEELRRRQRELEHSRTRYQALAQELEARVERSTGEIKTLYEQTAARSRELELLYQADEQLHRHLHLDRVLQALADIVVDQLKADKTSVMVWDEERRRLVIRGARGFSPEAIERMNRYRPGDGIAGKVFQTGETLAVEDTAAAPPPANRIALEEGIRSMLSVPISIDERIFGVFGMNYTRPRRFSPDDIRLGQSLAQRAALAIENARLYEQVEQAATLEERRRLARELHDSITQSLYSLALLAEAGRRHAAAGSLPQVEHHLERLGETAQQALKEMRLLVFELRPPALARLGLVEAIRRRLESVEKRAGIQARVTAEGIDGLPAEVEAQLYRIVLEALNNALKHARANRVSVALHRAANGIEVEVRDDGIGFDPQAAGGGIGLASMSERAARLNGRLSIESEAGRGTAVRAWAALPEVEAAVSDIMEAGE